LIDERLSGDRVKTVYTDAPGHAERIARETAPTCDALVAVGGDGTASEVATGILTSAAPDTPLGLLPMGTGNDFALALGIRNRDDAKAALFGGEARAVDVCEVHYATPAGTEVRLSLVGSAAGYPAYVVARTSERTKRIFRRRSYLVMALACSLRYRPPETRITIDGEERCERLLLCVVANTERTAGGTMRMAPGARVDDGLLNVILAAGVRPVAFLPKLGRLRTGAHVDLPEIEYRTAREVTIECVPDVDVTVDGDPVGTTPARFRVRPGVLRVLTPLLERADGEEPRPEHPREAPRQ